MRTAIGLVVIIASILGGMAVAGESVPLPQLPKAVKGDRCVEDTPFMRRNHMELLRHQRDETLRKGVRSKKYSLKNCINCHVTERADGTIASIKSRDHFCSSCHAYAAVKLDCFECHATAPDGDVATLDDSQ